MDESNLKSWEQVKKNDIIVLKDERHLHENIDGVPVTISRAERFHCDLFELLVFSLVEKPKSLIVVKKVIDIFEVRFYSEMEWIGKGSRNDLLSNGNQFLFQEPKDVNNFKPKDLQWAEKLILVDDKLGDLTFNQKNQGVVWGKWVDKDHHAYFAGIIEFFTENLTADPEILITEVGGENSDDGGWVVAYEGYKLEVEDLEGLI